MQPAWVLMQPAWVLMQLAWVLMQPAWVLMQPAWVLIYMELVFEFFLNLWNFKRRTIDDQIFSNSILIKSLSAIGKRHQNQYIIGREKSFE